MRDPRQLNEGLNPRALRAIKDTVRGMRVAYRCPTGTVRNKLVREIGTRGANQVRRWWWIRCLCWLVLCWCVDGRIKSHHEQEGHSHTVCSCSYC